VRGSRLFLRGGREKLIQIDKLLAVAYGTPESELGNKHDPLEEAVYIILSLQTDLPRLRRVWSELRDAFPNWEGLARARIDQIASVIRVGGLHRQKARTIKQLLAEVQRFAGVLSLDSMRAMSDQECESLLTGLPGLSWKAARCVLLYSLGRDAFPIDGNTFRILKRTGIISSSAAYRRRNSHDAVQNAVPPSLRRRLHVNLVVHGRRTCRPRSPRCPQCPLRRVCPRVGVKLRTDRTRKNASVPLAQ
jgi:endonuclease III